jgi:hypothetical protein
VCPLVLSGCGSSGFALQTAPRIIGPVIPGGNAKNYVFSSENLRGTVILIKLYPTTVGIPSNPCLILHTRLHILPIRPMHVDSGAKAGSFSAISPLPPKLILDALVALSPVTMRLDHAGIDDHRIYRVASSY